MKHGVILSEAFSARIKGIEALRAASNVSAKNVGSLRNAADGLDTASISCDDSIAAASYGALAGLLRIIAMLVEWRSAILDATPEAGRFLRSAKEQYKLWQDEYQPSEIPRSLLENSVGIDSITDLIQVGGMCDAIASVPLSVPFFAAHVHSFRQHKDDEQDSKEVLIELNVAFLHFEIDGQPANRIHFLTPQEAHDLEIEVRVSRWPDNATTLNLRPVSVEPPDTYDFPNFQFESPEGQAPFVMRQRGRALLKYPQNIHARPFEFKYAAEFTPRASEQPVAVVGHRTLRIESIDLQKSPMTGYLAMDKKLLKLRDSLRENRLIAEADLKSSLHLMTVLGNLAYRALNDDLYPGVRDEAEFQRDIRAELRRTPSIASELEEHPRTSGGITDLSFRGIRIELKVESKKRITLNDCSRFIGQTASYVIATGKRIGILCVLDCKPKNSPASPAEENFEILRHPTKEGEICIVTLIIQGNLPIPSSLSR
ncbi:MAG: Uncharacterized protein AWT59_2253 [Candidatus Gallionella acididurans]|uniref:Uncharacterized protein n=1 Tax=Candidatus Gallionella acididurans TaxID=1796491 RepID=A0A139BRL3_9PROT|nr:MAG: Uncharacterized protein AWT59_2253 [Candidatus Gallionella acididurans]